MHDCKGRQLKVGDKVTVEMTVSGLTPGAETCNCSLSREAPGEQSIYLTCQTKQVEKVNVTEDGRPTVTNSPGDESDPTASG